MLSDEQKEFIDHAVNETIKKSLPDIEKCLFSGVDDNTSLYHQQTQVLINTITISVQVSVQIVMEVLEHLDLASLPDDEASLLRSQIHPVNQER